MARTQIKNPVKELILGGGVISLFFLAASLFPLVGSFFSIFIPIPILVYYGRLGRSLGIMVSVLAVLISHILAMALRFPFNSIVIMQFALMGILMAEAFAREMSVEKSILVPSCSLFGFTIVLVLLQAAASHTTPTAVLHQYFVDTLQDTLNLYRAVGIPDAKVQKIEEAAGPVIVVLTRIAPALFLGMTSVIVWINVLVCKRILPRWGLDFPDFGDLTRWKSPEPLIWVLIGCGIALLIPVTAVNTLALNGLLIMLLVYFFQGIAIVAYFFKTYGVQPIVRIIGYALIIVQQLIMILVVGVGIFDLWFDFRKLNPGRPKDPGSQETGG